MVGMGIIKGLGITLQHFFDTYIEDIRWLAKRYNTSEGIALRTSTKARGAFTVQYPEEKIPVPEEYRIVPFLVYDEGENGEKKARCTACGICAKVCPTQCISITRATDPATGKPVPTPAEFYVDIDICMNCGLCAEYCPFDSMKMDHDYEIASYNRYHAHIYDKEKLLKPASYYASIRPVNYAAEQAARAEKEAAKAAAVAAAKAKAAGAGTTA